ncbi:Rv1733c family protein [Actinomadura macrotermitis]|uniref:Uncharacterized protein n=1 Tax=Actinomadura macrotermitis TaxID=2585200 RepID=A0A7K0BN79_9ACTN|nr:hypothetical protein [Actinomadura macrotermitis]MQY02613.1 hypothetical protein [Actinomadura macrotermitis]
MRRTWRRLGLERNPLRRRIDRVQRAFAVALLLLTLLIAVPAGAWSWHLAYSSGLRAEQAEHAARHRVVATVTAAGGIGTAGDRYVHETVRATWTGSDGVVRTGTLPSWKNARAGARRAIWVDRQGVPVVRPRPHSRTVTDAGYAAVAGALAAGAPMLGAYLLLRRRCDRHRADLWEAAWARMDADAGHNRPS